MYLNFTQYSQIKIRRVFKQVFQDSKLRQSWKLQKYLLAYYLIEDYLK